MADTAAVPLVEVPRATAPTRMSTSRLGSRVVLLVCAAAVAVLFGAWLGGIRLFVVDSPSMGEAAPVGTLVIGTVRTDQLMLGDVVTYRAPGPVAHTYTHRLVARVAGGFRTKGDANGVEDPWVVTQPMIVSRALALVPGVGWLVRAAPIGAAALIAVEIVSRIPAVAHWRAPVRLLGGSLATAVASVLYRPFTGFAVVQSVQSGGAVHVTLASTALLPLRFAGSGHTVLDLVPGQIGTLVLTRHGSGTVRIAAQPDLGPLGWALVALVCLTPVLAVLIFGVRMEEDGEPDAAPA